MYIALDLREQKEAIRCGKELYQNKLNLGTNVQSVDKNRDQEWLDILGIAGEMAVHKFVGQKYVFELFDVRDDCDITINNKRGDVKTIEKQKTLRIQKNHKDKDFDFYWLANHLGGFRFQMVGWVYKDEFFEEAELKAFKGYEDKPMYCSCKLRNPYTWRRI